MLQGKKAFSQSAKQWFPVATTFFLWEITHLLNIFLSTQGVLVLGNKQVQQTQQKYLYCLTPLLPSSKQVNKYLTSRCDKEAGEIINKAKEELWGKKG